MRSPAEIADDLVESHDKTCSGPERKYWATGEEADLIRAGMIEALEWVTDAWYHGNHDWNKVHRKLKELKND